jgi:hypothetical protein
MDSRILSALAIAAALVASPVGAQTVVDGDTIKLAGTTFRIWGIDAAETKQACGDGWMAGQEATAALLELVKGRTVTCDAKASGSLRPHRWPVPRGWRRPRPFDGERRHGMGLHPVQQRLRQPGAGGDRRPAWRACARLREALGLACESEGRPLTGVRRLASLLIR